MKTERSITLFLYLTQTQKKNSTFESVDAQFGRVTIAQEEKDGRVTVMVSFIIAAR